MNVIPVISATGLKICRRLTPDAFNAVISLSVDKRPIPIKTDVKSAMGNVNRRKLGNR